MSRTIRKDVNDKPYTEGRTSKIRYRCHCIYCAGHDKNQLVEKIRKKELNKQLKELSCG